MRLLAPLTTLFAGAITLSSLGAAETNAEAIAALEGGTPLPEGVHEIHFPNTPKQSISFISDAAERIAGTVEFSGQGSLGRATIDASAGSGSGSVTIPVNAMRTGNETRDQHMTSEGWMDAENHPEITFSIDELNKVADTVYEVTGTWTIKGESKQLTSLANLRYIPVFPNFGEDIVRVRAHFDLPIKEFGITHDAVGSPAVAEVWNISITLLGLPVEEE